MNPEDLQPTKAIIAKTLIFAVSVSKDWALIKLRDLGNSHHVLMVPPPLIHWLHKHAGIPLQHGPYGPVDQPDFEDGDWSSDKNIVLTDMIAHQRTDNDTLVLTSNVRIGRSTTPAGRFQFTLLAPAHALLREYVAEAARLLPDIESLPPGGTA